MKARPVRIQGRSSWVVVQFGEEASLTRVYCVAEDVTHRAARPDPSPRKECLFRMTIKLHHCQSLGGNCENADNWLSYSHLWGVTRLTVFDVLLEEACLCVARFPSCSPCCCVSQR